MARPIFIGVGSNLGERLQTIQLAQQQLACSEGILFQKSAPIYETAPVGGPPQGLFLNTVWEVGSTKTPEEILDLLLQIEQNFERKREVPNGPRTLDLDLLFCDDLVIQSNRLVLPHPKLQSRWFVLKPLWDLRPDFVHPIFGKSVCELLSEVHAPVHPTTKTFKVS